MSGIDLEVMKSYHEFATQIAEALDAAGVKPIEQNNASLLCSVLVVVAPHNGRRPTGQPIGGGLNYSESKGKWEVQVEVQEAQPLAEGAEQA